MSAWIYRRAKRNGAPAVEAKCAACDERRIRTWHPQDSMPSSLLFGEHACSAIAQAFVQDAPIQKWRLRVGVRKDDGKLLVLATCATCSMGKNRRWNVGEPPVLESEFGACRHCSGPRAQREAKMVPTIESDLLAQLVIRRLTRLVQALPPEMLRLIVEDT